MFLISYNIFGALDIKYSIRATFASNIFHLFIILILMVLIFILIIWNCWKSYQNVLISLFLKLFQKLFKWTIMLHFCTIVTVFKTSFSAVIWHIVLFYSVICIFNACTTISVYASYVLRSITLCMNFTYI